MWRTCSGLLNARRAPVPPKPLFWVANSVLCHVEKLSSWVQPCQLVVNGQLTPEAFSFAATSTRSGQVVGGFSGSRPALRKASLL